MALMLIWIFKEVFIVYILLGLNIYEIYIYVKVYSMSGPLYNSECTFIHLCIFVSIKAIHKIIWNISYNTLLYSDGGEGNSTNLLRIILAKTE